MTDSVLKEIAEWNVERELKSYKEKYPKEYAILITTLYQQLSNKTEVCALLKPKKERLCM